MSERPSKLSSDGLHAAFVEALDGFIVRHSALSDKPVEVDVGPPVSLRLRVYLYNVTHPPGGRTLGEHKIQLMVPGQGRAERGNFDHSGGRVVLLAGYEPELSVFVLWDAGLYRDFPFSRNVQVKAETVYGAYANGVCAQERRQWHAKEVVVAAYKTRLLDGIQLRAQMSLYRLLDGPRA
jgi:hypothetical protein